MARDGLRPHVVPMMALAVTATVAVWALVDSIGDPDWDDTRARPALAVGRAGVAALPLAAMWLYRWRPSARPWMFVAALSLVWSGWMSADGFIAAGVLAVLIRPLIFVLLVSWPTGRLERGDAWWIGIYSVSQAVVYSVVRQLFDRDAYGPGRSSPIHVQDVPRFAEMASALGSAVVLPVGAILLVVTLWRRYDGLPCSGRAMFRPILVSGVIVAVSDLIVVFFDFVPDLIDNEDGLTLVGGYVRLTVHFAPYVSLAILTVVAAHRASALRSTGRSTIDLGAATSSLDDRIGRLLGPGRTLVAFPLDDGGWIDQSGATVPDGDHGRVAATIERDGETLAAIIMRRDESTAPDVDLLELAVATASAEVEFARLEALANARARDAESAMDTLATARWDTLARLERDLHDGVQQRLVGLALLASLAERQHPPDDDVASDLAAGIDAARNDLAGCAAGMLPTLIAQRGLANSISTLTATASIDLHVDIHYPPDVPAVTAAAAWFVVAEAVANATKHADANELRISGSVVDGELSVVIADDGRGGARPCGSGLSGLRDRVERSGGTLHVDSPPGGGTTVLARFVLSEGAIA